MPRPRAALAATTDAQVECRLLGHWWDDVTGLVDGPKVRYLHGRRKELRCARGCGTTRHEVWGVREGTLTMRSYDYDEHYPDAGGLTKAQLRLEVLARREAAAPRRRRAAS